MSRLSVHLVLTGVAVALGAGVYIAARAGVIRSTRALRGLTFGAGFLLGWFATGTLCVLLIESSPWAWLRDILGPLGGAIVGYLGAHLVEGRWRATAAP